MTTVVVDANLSLAHVLPLPYSQAAVQRMRDWQEVQARVVVPALWEYEVVSGLRRACVNGMLTSEGAQEALHDILGMKFEVVGGTEELHKRALIWSEQLGQSKAYDAQYMALAELFGADLWTADRRLNDRADQLGVNWVYWIGT